MEGFFNTTQELLMVIFVMIAAAFLLQKVKYVKSMGPVLTVIIIGIILSNTGVVPASADLYGTINTYCVPLSICMYLMNLDLKRMKILLSRDTLLSFGSMLVCVCLVTIVSGLFFARHIDEGWKLAGMFVGTYTGGSSQLTAIGTGLEASSNTLVMANAADYVVGMPALVLFFAAPAIMKGSKAFNRFWPNHLSQEQLLGDGSHEGLMDRKEWSIKDIAYMLAIALVVVAASTKLSEILFSESLRSPMRIILITTFTILIAQIPFVQTLKGNLDLGLLFSMIFLSTIGIQVNASFFSGSALYATLFCLVVILGSTVLHFVITRLLKVKYEFVLLSIVAGIADGTTSAMVASGAGWKTLIQVGMVMGVLAGAMGNYVGIGIAYLVKGLCGV